MKLTGQAAVLFSLLSFHGALAMPSNLEVDAAQSSCAVLAYDSKTCSGGQGSVESIPTSGTKCEYITIFFVRTFVDPGDTIQGINIGPNGFRHSIEIFSNCPTLKITGFGARDCKGQSTGTITRGPSCAVVNNDAENQSILVGYN
jgi:hypothetical protein